MPPIRRIQKLTQQRRRQLHLHIPPSGEVIAKKAAKFKVFVVRTIDLEMRGKTYRIILDGHHNLAATRLIGAEPTWKGPPAKLERVMKGMTTERLATFMINNLTDSDWYLHDTGQVVEDFLAPQL